DGVDDINNLWFIGKPININYGYVYDGVWQTGENNDLQPDAKPGDVKVKDVNGDGKITADDRSFIGQSVPKYFAGLMNTFSYKNLTLSVFINSQFGVTKVNPLWDTDIVYVDARRNTIKLNWWSESNPTNEYPANRNYTNPYAVRFYQNADFIRVRDITLSYSFPSGLLEGTGIKRAMVYGNVKNAGTFTSYKGLDPELSGQRDI